MEKTFGRERFEEMNRTAYVTANLFAEQIPNEEFAVYCPVTSEYHEELGMEVAEPGRSPNER